MLDQFHTWRDWLFLSIDTLNDAQLSVLAREMQALADYLSKLNHERRIKARS